LLLSAVPVPLVEFTKRNVKDSAELHVLGFGPDTRVALELVFKHPHLLLGQLPPPLLLVGAVVQVLAIGGVDYLIHYLIETDHLILGSTCVLKSTPFNTLFYSQVKDPVVVSLISDLQINYPQRG